jgi:uncharacterized damage-inducible protein DinB
MSERASELAQQFTAANDELIGVLTGANEAQLQAICPADGWPVLLTARHVALSYRVVGSWIRKVANGQEVTTSRAQIDEGNAQHAATYPQPDRDEVLGMLRDNAAKTAEMIHGFTDEQLAASAPFAPGDGRPLSADQVIRHVLLHHVQEHLPDIQAALRS